MIDGNLLGFRAERERDAVRMATVIQVLLDTHGGGLGDWKNAARQILTDLAAHDVPTGEFSGELLQADFGLTVAQEVRARALDSAAHLLGPCVGEVIGEAPSGVVLDAAGDEWLRLAVNGARYIESGTVLPDLADG